jgi:hypothetical protein
MLTPLISFDHAKRIKKYSRYHESKKYSKVHDFVGPWVKGNYRNF